MRRLLRPARQATYDTVFAGVYTALMTNLLLAVACAPLVLALALVGDPFASWPLFAVLSPVCAPALAGAFGCFAGIGEGSARVAGTFWRTYRRAAPRALAAWTAGLAAVGVLAVDVAAVAGTPWGPALVPFFVTAAVLVMAAVVAVLVLAAEPPPGRFARTRDAVLPCLYLVARRWYLAAASVAVLALAAAVVLARPVAGGLVLCSPLLYAGWATTRFVVAPLLPAGRVAA
ncbi:hypothetical protein ABZT47_33710 [Sphaerisporangium sp. NPDC005289]|uniref:hypothetical protein n=1 Tax=Sphaerisporangium sp. NPDC005289 TaxID=3155247 RepID=UPI0033BBD135